MLERVESHAGVHVSIRAWINHPPSGIEKRVSRVQLKDSDGAQIELTGDDVHTLEAWVSKEETETTDHDL